jgi:hypothetical protein
MGTSAIGLRPQLLANPHDQGIGDLPRRARKHRENPLPFFVL